MASETDTKTEPDHSAGAPSKYRGLSAPWVKGQSGNPKGKKPGTRNKVIEASIRALGEDFDLHGADALRLFRMRDPGGYCKMVFTLHPRKIEAKVETTNLFQDLDLRNPKEFAQAYDLARQVLGGKIPALIDVTPEPELEAAEEASYAWKSDYGQDD